LYEIVMQKHPTNKSASGFTLIELLIVIAIIGIPRRTVYLPSTIYTSLGVFTNKKYKIRVC
jgi:prepilin-type N-terminal cleavage/methylation domain-containing protein